MIPVILSGGSGTRLWPLSRALKPKQFIALHGDLSLFQATLDRIKNLSIEGETVSPPIIVCNEEHRFIVAEQSRSLDVIPQKILLEPTARNTAPAIAAATLSALVDGDDPILLVLAADHVIGDTQAFNAALTLAKVEVNKGKIVTFGVVPTKPETGYGYIRTQAAAVDGAAHVDAFVEKPDLATAQGYLEQGNYFWNSGMFMFRASVMKAELERLSPEIMVAAELSLSNAAHDQDFTRLSQVDFVNAPNVSIDYAVMEKTHIASVVILDSPWSDLGAWDSVWEAGLKDQNQNCTLGDVLLQDVTNSYVHASHRLVTVAGINDVVVVETADAILVTTKDHAQDVKKIVAQLTEKHRIESTSHREVYRPWGKYDSVDQGYRYQVKRITVKPGHKLSVQLHHHRAEHWIVVSGTANVQIADKQVLLTEDQAYLLNSGAEACEAAIKLARKWGQLHRGGAYRIITASNGCHGRSFAAMSASAAASENRFEPQLPGFSHVPFNDLPALHAAVDAQTVAIMLEPIQNDAGVIPATEHYLKGVERLCRELGILLILDEVQTGTGRCGTLLAEQHYGVRADIITLGKGLGGGVPLAALLARGKACCFELGELEGTHHGNALMASAGLAVLDTVLNHGFLEHICEVGAYLGDGLARLAHRYGQGELRGQGLLWGLSLSEDSADAVVKAALSEGLILSAPQPDCLRFTPALTLSKSNVDEMLLRLARAFSRVRTAQLQCRKGIAV